MAEPRVTAVIPFWNAAPYLGEAIESVLAQTFTGWELILVDDGSTDGSREIARDYAGRHPERIRCLEHPGRRRRGASASRNLGVAAGQGELVAFLDADDLWLPEKLERQLALLDAHPAVAMVYNPTLQWYSWSGRPEDRGRDVLYDLSPLVGRVIEPPEAVPLFVTERVPCPCTCSYLIRRPAHDAVGGSDDAFPGMYDDQVLVMKIHLRFPVLVAGECLDWYRIRADSTYQGAIQAGEVAAARLRFLDWLGAHLRQTGWRGNPLLKTVAAERSRLRPSRPARLRRAWRLLFDRQRS